MKFTHTLVPLIYFDDPTHFIIFSDTKGIFRNPEQFFVVRNVAAEHIFNIGSCFWLQMSVNLLVSFHAFNVQLEYRKLFCGYVAPYVDPLCFTGTSFRFKFGRELIGVIKINVQGFIFHSYDSLGDYVSEH